MKPFLDILYHLSHLTNLKLYPDQNGACKLLIGENIFVQLEPDFSQENLLIASIISEVSVGKFRETFSGTLLLQMELSFQVAAIYVLFQSSARLRSIAPCHLMDFQQNF